MVESRSGMQEPAHQVNFKRVHAGKANKHRIFTGVRETEILEHLFKNYGEILAQDLVANRVEIGGEWDPTTPFQTLFTKVQDIQ